MISTQYVNSRSMYVHTFILRIFSTFHPGFEHNIPTGKKTYLVTNSSDSITNFFLKFWTFVDFRAVASGGGAGGGGLPPQFLAKQLTLSQPGGQIIPTKVLRAPPEFQTLRRA